MYVRGFSIASRSKKKLSFFYFILNSYSLFLEIKKQVIKIKKYASKWYWQCFGKNEAKAIDYFVYVIIQKLQIFSEIWSNETKFCKAILSPSVISREKTFELKFGTNISHNAKWIQSKKLQQDDNMYFLQRLILGGILNNSYNDFL